MGRSHLHAGLQAPIKRVEENRGALRRAEERDSIVEPGQALLNVRCTTIHDLSYDGAQPIGTPLLLRSGPLHVQFTEGRAGR